MSRCAPAHALSSQASGQLLLSAPESTSVTGINSLKIGYNRVFGYYIEISRANQHLVPKDYERRQTLTNAERYTTPELKTREAEVLGAEEKICALEQKLFLNLRDSVADWSLKLHETGIALAELDALCSLAEVAHKKGHVRPALSNTGLIIWVSRVTAAQPSMVSSTWPTFMREGTPNGFSAISHGVPSAI